MAKPPEFTPALDSFAVDLPVFQGPFDLLLQLIARQELDVTEVALSKVTDEFISYMSRFPDLSTTTDFLVVAATLLNMKAARLLPDIGMESEDSADDLSMRDLLFSRLLQYRAFKEMAKIFANRLVEEGDAIARAVPMEPHFAVLLPELIWKISPDQLASLAVAAMRQPSAPDEAAHVARPRVSVEEQVAFLEQKLRAEKRISFESLVAQTHDLSTVIGRFLALLELYRRRLVIFDQEAPLSPLNIAWEGT